ncbi:MAG: hypothetical protein LBD41_04520 [Clostridiales Family XIII bacterium]|jgi:hypothetical protein|nr:hypothetical protein [Clostridiales Family XIII bacterium]
MTDLEKFEKVWNGEFLAAKQMGQNNRLTPRGYQMKVKYEDILFSIWKHHNDWDDINGFQLKCFYKECPEYRTLYRVRKLAEDAGLLIKTRNYFVDDHPNEYHKNIVLFDKVFRGKINKYGKWLNEIKVNPDRDVIGKLLKDEFNNIKNSDNNYNRPKLNTASKNTRLKNKISQLNYDLEKLYSISDKMLDRYYNLLLRLNKAVVHDELKFITFLHYDKDGFPTGRPYSYFCSSGNNEKKHKDPSLELRSQFLKRIGIPDYFEVYDIKSEIPRVNWLFHTGEWKDDNYDFYAEITKEVKNRTDDDEIISRDSKRNTTHQNDTMKQLFMRIYFRKGTELQAFNGYKDEKLEREKDIIKDTMYYFGKRDKSEFLPFDFNYWYEICQSTEKICGPSIHNLVFWFSFFIETEVKVELLKRGKKVYNVYDGFYYDEDIKDEIVEILENKAKYVYDKYMRAIKK